MAHMAQDYPPGSSDGGTTRPVFLSYGDTVIGLQKEWLQAYQRLSRFWLERMQVEVALWRRLSSDLASSRSDADIMKACTDHMTRQFRMAAEDGRHIFSDYREIVKKFASAETGDTHAIDSPASETMPDSVEPRVTH